MLITSHLESRNFFIFVNASFELEKNNTHVIPPQLLQEAQAQAPSKNNSSKNLIQKNASSYSSLAKFSSCRSTGKYSPANLNFRESEYFARFGISVYDEESG
jgi:hypothetical protein